MSLRIWVVPLSLCLFCMTRKKTAKKKWSREAPRNPRGKLRIAFCDPSNLHGHVFLEVCLHVTNKAKDGLLAVKILNVSTSLFSRAWEPAWADSSLTFLTQYHAPAFFRTRQLGDVISGGQNGVTGLLKKLKHFRSHTNNTVTVGMVAWNHVASMVCCIN